MWILVGPYHFGVIVYFSFLLLWCCQYESWIRTLYHYKLSNTKEGRRVTRIGILHLELAIGIILKRRDRRRTHYGILFTVRGITRRIVQMDSALEWYHRVELALLPTFRRSLLPFSPMLRCKSVILYMNLKKCWFLILCCKSFFKNLGYFSSDHRRNI